MVGSGWALLQGFSWQEPFHRLVKSTQRKKLPSKKIDGDFNQLWCYRIPKAQADCRWPERPVVGRAAAERQDSCALWAQGSPEMHAWGFLPAAPSLLPLVPGERVVCADDLQTERRPRITDFLPKKETSNTGTRISAAAPLGQEGSCDVALPVPSLMEHFLAACFLQANEAPSALLMLPSSSISPPGREILVLKRETEGSLFSLLPRDHCRIIGSFF